MSESRHRFQPMLDWVALAVRNRNFGDMRSVLRVVMEPSAVVVADHGLPAAVGNHLLCRWDSN